MIIKNKEIIEQYLKQLPGKYLDEILEYLHFLNLKGKMSIVIKSEDALAKEWLTTQEDEAWKHL